MIGRTISHYRITEKLGQGGMGEVFLAEDSTLGRKVALKFLPDVFSGDPERLARFEREAKLLASLNHTNIAAIYGFEQADGKRFLVMELVEGENLAQRIAKGSLPTNEALDICRQVAEGLEFAHEHSIIHRDLKPSNIKVRPDGVAKILDFGLARAMQGDAATTDLSHSPTITEAATKAGVILGTAGYMAPEQVRGKSVDHRADIWSFGAVLYELLTGRRLYEGETVNDTLAAVLKVEPDWSALPTEVPPVIRRLLRRCLTRGPRERLQAIGEARIAIEEYFTNPTGTETAEPKPIAKGRMRERLGWALAVVLPLAAIAGTVAYMRLTQVPANAIVSEIPLPEETQFSHSGSPPVISPDGRTVAFCGADASGKTLLWVRPLDSPSALPLAGTDGAELPFWSADSRGLGFFADGKLKTIEASGGPALNVADAPIAGGGSWNRDGTILFAPAPNKGLYQVADSGGTPVAVPDLGAGRATNPDLPEFLPDGKHFLSEADASDPTYSGIYFASLDGKEGRLILRGGRCPVYASGFLLYLRDGTLMAQAFDPEHGQLKGNAQIVVNPPVLSHHASENGLLIYVGGSPGTQLRWYDRTGKELGVVGEVDAYYNPRLSPDGTKLAVNRGLGNSNLWVAELDRDFMARLTNDPDTDHGRPIWSPDGSRIIFSVLVGKAPSGIYQKSSNGTGAVGLLVRGETSDLVWPTSWSPDGGFILFSQGEFFSHSHGDIWLLPLSGDRKPRLFLKTPVAAYDGQFSPDGRWVAYTSKESGREEVYVVPFEAAKVLNKLSGSPTDAGGRWQISPGGGRCPRWRGDGKEIFYLALDNEMIAAEVEGRGDRFESRKTQPLFRTVAEPTTFPYDVTPDGKRFIVVAPRKLKTSFILVTNWRSRLSSKP